MLERLTAERDRIDQQITDLAEVRSRLDNVIALAKGPDQRPYVQRDDADCA
ncbi:MerR family transcriptional regulator [Streptomyces olivochromogenes]|uniref:hypothetical protein n=1 Tax=Streptomyces olivochromogenes TaxID=1963 RepID=UPI0036936B33